MKCDIREKTTLVVEKDGQYLMAFNFFLRYALSPYDAWQTRDIEAAQMVADRIKGNLMLFNPVVGQIRTFRGTGWTKMNSAKH